MAIKELVFITIVEYGFSIIPILGILLIAKVGNKLSPVAVRIRHVRIFQASRNRERQYTLNAIPATLKTIYASNISYHLKVSARKDLL